MTKAPERVSPALPSTLPFPLSSRVSGLSSAVPSGRLFGPSPAPAGNAGPRLESPTPMSVLMPKPMLSTKSFAIFIALAVAPAGCFDPLVTEEPSGGSGETDGGTAVEPTTAQLDIFARKNAP